MSVLRPTGIVRIRIERVKRQSDADLFIRRQITQLADRRPHVGAISDAGIKAESEGEGRTETGGIIDDLKYCLQVFKRSWPTGPGTAAAAAAAAAAAP